jgi:hypothetical protein
MSRTGAPATMQWGHPEPRGGEGDEAMRWGHLPLAGASGA